MRQNALSESWPEKPLVARRTIASLEKLAGPEFVDVLLEAVNAGGGRPARQEQVASRPAWWKQAVAYRIYLPSFMDADHDGVGDLAGVLQRLPYLEKLGVDLLWLSSLQEAVGKDEGPVPLGRIQPEFGDDEDFDALIAAATARGMRVVLELDAAGNFASLPQAMAGWRARGVSGFCLVNLNLLGRPVLDNQPPAPGLRGLRRYLCGPAVRARVQELAAALREKGEDVLLVGETPLAGPVMAQMFCTKRGGDLDLLFETGHLMRPAPPDVPQLDLSELKNRYLRWYSLDDGSAWMPLGLQTASMPRLVSRVGASGVYRTAVAKMLGTLTLTLRGTPVLYQGEELGLVNTKFAGAHELRDERALSHYEEVRGRLGETVALQIALSQTGDHARVPFPWSGAAQGGFTGAQPWLRTMDGIEFMNANVQMGDKNSVWTHFARLIDLRRKHPALVYGEMKPVFARNRRVFCFFRVLEGEKWYVEINLTGSETARPGRLLRTMRLELANYGTPAKSLRPYEANLYRCE